MAFISKTCSAGRGYPRDGSPTTYGVRNRAVIVESENSARRGRAQEQKFRYVAMHGCPSPCSRLADASSGDRQRGRAAKRPSELLQPRIQRVAKAVAEEVEAEDGD